MSDDEEDRPSPTSVMAKIIGGLFYEASRQKRDVDELLMKMAVPPWMHGYYDAHNKNVFEEGAEIPDEAIDMLRDHTAQFVRETHELFDRIHKNVSYTRGVELGVFDPAVHKAPAPLEPRVRKVEKWFTFVNMKPKKSQFMGIVSCRASAWFQFDMRIGRWNFIFGRHTRIYAMSADDLKEYMKRA